MADTTINLGDVNPEQIKNRFGWATETTLSKLLASNQISEQALLKIAQHFKIDVNELKNLNRTSQSQANSAADIVSGIDTLNKNTTASQKTMIKATRGLGEGLVKEFMNAQGDKARGLFDVFSTPLTSFSHKIEFINPKLFTFSKLLGSAFLIFGTIIHRLQEMNDNMRMLYATGIRLHTGQVGMLQAATDVGLTLQEFSKIIVKYGNVAVGLGTKRLTDLSRQFSIATSMGSDFVMTQSEAQEALLDTMNIMQNAGILRTMSDTQVVNASKDYLLQINELAAATGKSREEIRKNALVAAQTPAVYTAMRALPIELRNSFNSILTNVTARFGSQGSQLMDEVAKFMTGGVGMMSREYQLLFSQMGSGMGNELKALADATARGDQAAANRSLERMGQLLQELTPQQQKQLQLMSKSNPAFQSLLVNLQKDTQAAYDHRKMIESLSPEEREAYKIEQDRQKQEQKAFNDAQKALSGLRNTIDGVIARLGPVVIPMLDLFANGLIKVLDVFNSFIGGAQKLLKPVLGKDGASVGGAIIAAISGVTIMVILKKVFQAMMSGGIRMLSGAIGPLLGGTGAAASAVGGRAVGGLLSGLGSGLAGLGRPQVLLGVAALAGIGSALWIASKAIGNFASLDWETMGKGFATLLGMGVLGAIAGAAAPLLIAGSIAIGALGLALIPFAAAAAIAGPAMEQFGKALKSSFEGLSGIIESVGKAIASVVDSFTNMRTGVMDKTTDQIERLSKLPGEPLIQTANGITALKNALEDFSPGILAGFSQFMGSFLSSDPVERLQKLANVGNQLGTAASNIEKFRSSIGPLIGQPANTTTGAVTQNASPVISTEQLSMRTLKYYEDSIERMNILIEELEKSNTTLNNLRRDNADNTNKTISAIESSGNRIK